MRRRPAAGELGRNGTPSLEQRGRQARQQGALPDCGARMSYGRRTKDYVGKRKRDGKSKKEAIRCLKRYIAREVFRALRSPLEIKGPSWKDLRLARQALGITLAEAGRALNVGFQRVSYAETGRLMNVRFLEEYDAWLKSQAKQLFECYRSPKAAPRVSDCSPVSSPLVHIMRFEMANNYFRGWADWLA